MTGMEAAISIDRNFVRFGTKSYATNKINSVDVRQSKPHGKGMFLLFSILAAFSLLSALGSLSRGNEAPVGALLLAALFAVIAYGAYQRSKIILYHLFLMTSSSETQAFSSQSDEEIRHLRTEIEQAMTLAPGS